MHPASSWSLLRALGESSRRAKRKLLEMPRYRRAAAVPPVSARNRAVHDETRRGRTGGDVSSWNDFFLSNTRTTGTTPTHAGHASGRPLPAYTSLTRGVAYRST